MSHGPRQEKAFALHLLVSLKAVKHLDDVGVMEASHDLNFPLQVLQLLLRPPHFGDELQGHHLSKQVKLGSDQAPTCPDRCCT